MTDNIEIVRKRMPRAALFELLAEECAELGHSCLKAARILRRENPTPMSLYDALQSVVEEYADVVLTADVLDLAADEEIMGVKLARWAERMEAKYADDV